jgi:excisionase family DNA binding protein
MKPKFDEIPDELQSLRKELKQLKELIVSEKENEPVSDEQELITLNEATELLHISKTTIWRYAKQGKVTKYSIGGKRYFKKDELLNSLVKS